MTGPAPLEQGYRRALACCPAAFRRANEDQMLAVLAHPGGSVGDRCGGGAQLGKTASSYSQQEPVLPIACASKAARHAPASGSGPVLRNTR